MGYEIIEVFDQELETTPVLEAFDAKLKRALTKGNSIVPIKLRPEMDDCSQGLDWLEQWNRQFLQAGKLLVIIPATPLQYECLAISHPDQHLTYVESLEELEKEYPELQEPTASTELSSAHPYEASGVKEVATSSEEPAKFLGQAETALEAAAFLALEVARIAASTAGVMLKRAAKGDVMMRRGSRL